MATLVIVSLTLEEQDEHVSSIIEAQLKQPAILWSKTSKPGSRGSLDEHTALNGSTDALLTIISGVVSHLRPEIINIYRRAGSEVEAKEGGLAVSLTATAKGPVLCSTYRIEQVKDSNITRIIAGQVYTEQNSA